MKKIHYSQQRILPEDVAALKKVLNSGWIAGSGPKTKEYEEAVADFTGYRFAIAVNSATAGLEICYKWYFSGLKYVYIPTLTFVATANVAYRQGLGIKFADADDKTLAGYTPDVSVSYAGYPLQGDGLVADDAHYLFRDMAQYGRYKARVLSHHAIKTLGNSGEGGTILTDDEEFAMFALEYRNHGRDSNGLTVFAGSNCRMTDIQAALLLEQLSRWDSENSMRHEIAQYYRESLRGVVELPPYHKRHSLHLFPIKLRNNDERDAVQLSLLNKGIGTQINYRPVHMQPLYQHIQCECPVSEDHFNRSVSIPMHLNLRHDDLVDIVSEITGVVNRDE